MKKMICLTLIFALLIPMIPDVITVSAAESSANDDVKTFTSQEYGYTYTEYTDENYQTIRTYRKESPVYEKTSPNGHNANGTQLSLSQDATKDLLASLGMEEAFISKLSEEDLQEYSNSSEIMAVTSYTKKDADGNTVNVTKEEALNAAVTRAIVPTPDPGGWASYETSYTDSYMYIAYVVSYRGNGEYKFSVDSTWLTMPIFRGTDSLGACAQNMTVENNTRSGWYSYDWTFGSLATYSNEYVNNNLASGSFYNAINGNWYGSAVMFNLPNDVSTNNYISLISNYRVHYEYTGKVNYPNQQMNFNTTATYCHTTVGINVALSLGISTSGPSASIGITGTTFRESRTAEFSSSITYTP